MACFELLDSVVVCKGSNHYGFGGKSILNHTHYSSAVGQQQQRQSENSKNQLYEIASKLYINYVPLSPATVFKYVERPRYIFIYDIASCEVSRTLDTGRSLGSFKANVCSTGTYSSLQPQTATALRILNQAVV